MSFCKFLSVASFATALSVSIASAATFTIDPGDVTVSGGDFCFPGNCKLDGSIKGGSFDLNNAGDTATLSDLFDWQVVTSSPWASGAGKYLVNATLNFSSPCLDQWLGLCRLHYSSRVGIWRSTGLDVGIGHRRFRRWLSAELHLERRAEARLWDGDHDWRHVHARRSPSPSPGSPAGLRSFAAWRHGRAGWYARQTSARCLIPIALSAALL